MPSNQCWPRGSHVSRCCVIVFRHAHPVAVTLGILEASMRTILRSTIYCALIALLLASPVFAQMTTTGTVEGTIIDPSGKTVPAATVNLVSESTKDVRTITAGENGSFTF